MSSARPRFLLGVLAFGYAFLYLPILSVIVYSFNESRLVTVWAGLSLKWWREVLRNEALLDAAFLSLQIAAVNACVATALGTVAGFALARRPRFAGRTLFAALVAAPMVMPEVVMGIATLLLFVGLEMMVGWPQRGVVTITIAHITFSMAFVAVIVQSRLRDFDRSLEEAAMDLGCPPVKTFVTITLPLIAPALVSGWMLALTLSLDDPVLASFTTGPGATTLPIRIYSEIRLGVKPEINAICTILIALVAIVIVAAALLGKFHSIGRERAHGAAI